MKRRIGLSGAALAAAGCAATPPGDAGVDPANFVGTPVAAFERIAGPADFVTAEGAGALRRYDAPGCAVFVLASGAGPDAMIAAVDVGAQTVGEDAPEPAACLGRRIDPSLS